jgi:nitroimidazol reductase NimA-like FMN-containing flavoprotein (pyridoxamine 5'-phosphate oxidase superfamily)
VDFDPRTGLEILDEDTCWELLRAEPLGRIAVAVDGRQELWPVNFAVSDRAIYVRTDVGLKLATVPGRDAVFEVDAASERFETGWSVIARGRFTELTEPTDIGRAELLDLRPWSLAGKPRWLRFSPDEISGRRITKVGGEFTD